MSAAQVAHIRKPEHPVRDLYLVERLQPILRDCKRERIRIITN